MLACMRKQLLWSSLLWLSTTACLPAFNPPPGGDPGSGTPPGGTGGNNQSPTGSADMAMAPGGGGGGGGGGGSPSHDMAQAGGGGGDMAALCDPLASTAGLSSPSGHHNAGQECQGCHSGGGAPTFYIAGTLYDTVNGTTAIAGATIHITDGAGKSVTTISAQNGNFWTTTALTYPIKVSASLCPNTQPMNGSVSGNGACNNCHNSTFRVHLP
jgi:hypothetical protein